jgi:hypothetical protein
MKSRIVNKMPFWAGQTGNLGGLLSFSSLLYLVALVVATVAAASACAGDDLKLGRCCCDLAAAAPDGGRNAQLDCSSAQRQQLLHTTASSLLQSMGDRIRSLKRLVKNALYPMTVQ